MKDVSTPSKNNGTEPCTRPRHNPASPRKSTLILIRQFARAYSCQPAMPVALGSFIAN